MYACTCVRGCVGACVGACVRSCMNVYKQLCQYNMRVNEKKKPINICLGGSACNNNHTDAINTPLPFID